MSGSLFAKSKAVIGEHSDGNLIVQNSNIDNLVVCNNSTDMFKMLGDMGKYDAIQRQFSELASVVRTTHPLYPQFGVTYRYDLGKLVSTPETDEALSLYPKYVKSLIKVDYKDYPYMDRSELPWEYAYRTQEPVTVDAKSYKEYLGDIEDPFPIYEYADGMKIVINAPEFPPAVEGRIVSGDVSIPVSIRRKPCKQYGKTMIGTLSENNGFVLDITSDEINSRTNFNFKKEDCTDLKALLEREKFIEALRTTKSFQIFSDGEILLGGSFDDDKLKHHIFMSSKFLVRYIENLLNIESFTGCHFNTFIEEATFEDLRTADILLSSLKNIWCRENLTFDDEIRCNYDTIDESLLEDGVSDAIMASEIKNSIICLQGQTFYAEKYYVHYEGARINNIESVRRNCKRKKKDILITFKPVKGREHFVKFCRFEGIKLKNE